MTITTTLTARYADNRGVRLHYMAGGDGPLIVLVHGFPDYWFTWRHQIDGLAANHSIAAMDTRGYNLSDAPTGEDAYAMKHLVDDIAAVILAESRTSATIVGHDWGGATAWAFARTHPAMTERVVVVNTPHPDNITAALQDPGSDQAEAFAYTADFRQPGSEAHLDANTLAGFVARTEDERDAYIAAFERSDFQAMMNYYRANGHADRHIDTEDPATVGCCTSEGSTMVAAPVLQIHGLGDPTLLAGSLNNTWTHLSNTWTLLTIPNAGHNAHHDQPELVTKLIHDWLDLPLTTTPDAPLDQSTAGCCAINTPVPPTEGTAGCCS